jgi:CMP-N,N'-diacetyllegionaminic acid synthase
MDNFTLAFIGARKNSKGLPGKNVRSLLGRPMIDYTFESAQKSKMINEIFVSTDDPEILRMAAKRGIPNFYVRPDELATDGASIIDAVLHGLQWRKENGLREPDVVVLLQPTSPLRTSKHIDGAINTFTSKKLKSLVGVSEMTEHPFKCIEQNESNWNYLREHKSENTNRQQYPSNFYCINGAMYIVRKDWFLENHKWVVPGQTYLHIMDHDVSVDVDSERDFLFVEALLAKNLGSASL